MAENFGGPVWHASGRGKTISESRRIASDALRGVGDARLGEWRYEGEGAMFWHHLRRLSAQEQETYGVPEPFDIRGTPEERRRVEIRFAEAPSLRLRLGSR